MQFLIRYYDISWETHSARIEADSIEAALKELAGRGVPRSDVITYFVIDTEWERNQERS